jgi:hypothetical protein
MPGSCSRDLRTLHDCPGTLHRCLSPVWPEHNREARSDRGRNSGAGSLGTSRRIPWREQEPLGPIRFYRRRRVDLLRPVLLAKREGKLALRLLLETVRMVFAASCKKVLTYLRKPTQTIVLSEQQVPADTQSTAGSSTGWVAAG